MCTVVCKGFVDRESVHSVTSQFTLNTSVNRIDVCCMYTGLLAITCAAVIADVCRSFRNQYGSLNNRAGAGSVQSNAIRRLFTICQVITGAPLISPQPARCRAAAGVPPDCAETVCHNVAAGPAPNAWAAIVARTHAADRQGGGGARRYAGGAV